MAAQRNWDGVDAGAHIGLHKRPEVAAQRLEGTSQQIAGQAQESAGLRAALNDHAVGLTDQQKRAIGLDRGGEVDLLPLTIGKIGCTEGGGRALT